MRVGRCMQRKSWGGEEERTGNGAVEGNEEKGNGCVCLVPEGGIMTREGGEIE